MNEVGIEFDKQPAKLNFIRDITEQRKLEDRLKMAQKMEAIGTLAGGIAHDFNNILSPIMGYTELVMDELNPGSKAYKNLSQVFNAANRARELVQQILTFSRQSEREPTPLKIQLVVNEALKLLRASIPANIKFDLSIDKNCAPVLADPTQIHQIVMNLCTNAYQAMHEQGGLLMVKLEEIEIIPGEPGSHDGLTAGRYILLQVSDTGHGMEHSILQRIFDPFFTTKEKQHGTGMGLSVVHGIVKQHKGLIDVQSEPGAGSSFRVFLPAHTSGSELIDLPEAKVFIGNNETILLVDDEKAILNLLKQLLEDLNYKVVTCEDSLEAVEIFKERPNTFDLVITDQIMPNLTGDLLAKQLLQIRSDLPIILCTGFSESLDEEKSRQIGIHSVIMKPVLKSSLSGSIRQALTREKIKK
jgi:nitrogen-specific signal transduction histidine kinase/ActR/RegA family two-component response regulator